MSITHSAQSNLSQLGDIFVYCQDYIFAAVTLFKTLSLLWIFLNDSILKVPFRE